MERLLWFQLSVAAAVLLVFCLRQMMRRMPKIYSYLLWLLVFARLLCPVSFESRIAIMPSPQVQTDIVLTHFVPSVSGQVQEEAEVKGTGAAEQVWKENGSYENHWKELAVLFWILGAASILSYNMAAFWQLKCRMRDARCLEGNVYISSRTAIPFTMGLFRPHIYLPEGIGEREQEYILCHERIHIKRKDYLVKNIAFLLTAFYWWNPFVWLAFYFMEQDMEMSCDEAVLKELKGNFRREYAQSLLNFATGKCRKMAAPLTFGGSSVGKRVKNILSGKNSKKWMGVMGIAVFLCAGLLIFTIRDNGEAVSVGENSSQILAGEDVGDTLERLTGENEENASSLPAGENVVQVSMEKNEEILAYVQKWAAAFCGRDGSEISDMLGDNETLAADLEERLLLDREQGSFGWSSPWPWREEYQIVNMTDTSAEILYYALTSEPHVTVWRERLTYEKQDNGTFAVTGENLKELDSIVTAEEFYCAYPGGVIAGTPMEYETKELYAASQTSASLYEVLQEPHTAARYLFNILNNENKVIMETEQQGEEVKVTFHFLEDGSSAEVMMTSFQDENGKVIWVPKNDTTTETGSVNVDTLIVRLEPKENAKAVSLLPKEQLVTLLGEENGFYKVSVDINGENLEGYIKKEYLSTDAKLVEEP